MSALRNLVRAHRRKLAAIAGFACVVIAVSGVQHQSEINRDQSHINEMNGRALLASCQRVNGVIVESNVQSSALYTLLSLTVADLTKQNLPGASTYLADLQATLSAEAWTPPTDCRRAIAISGAHYHLAKPVPFSKHSAPPSALTAPKDG